MVDCRDQSDPDDVDDGKDMLDEDLDLHDDALSLDDALDDDPPPAFQCADAPVLQSEVEARAAELKKLLNDHDNRTGLRSRGPFHFEDKGVFLSAVSL
jgi:hypothetical protein